MTRLSYILATLAFVFGLLVPTSVLNAQDDVRERRCKFIEELLLSDSPQQLVDAARDFQWTCSQFAGALAVAEGPEVLIPGLRTFEAKWADLHNRLVPFKVPLIQGHVAACNSSLEQLRQVFGTRSEVNHEEKEHLIAELDELTHELMETVAATVPRDRKYRASLRQSLGPLRAQIEPIIAIASRFYGLT